MDTKTKAAVLKAVEKIAENESERTGVTVSEEAAVAIAGLVEVLASTLGADLESFAHHAKRKAIQPEDVLLFARRNEPLKAHLEASLENLRSSKKQRSKAGASKDAAAADSDED